ncbi:MAG: FAD binding domain-containing protein [Actinomycetota bacterium]|nr:FAD binding domain-containing protein [Actinomycetota bacterium]MDA3004918.1 FAD binding domain-containing protein [Actinomycetota bacterium]
MSVVVPRTLKDALSATAANPSALIVQGGTDLMVEINFNHRKPTDVIALRRVDELRSFQINADKTQITIGAGLPYQTMEHGEIADLVPALAQAARTVGSPQIRATGSIGGNLGTCSPAGDALPVLSALDASVNLQTANTSRSVSIHDFMVGVKRNSRQPGEIIVSTTLPIISGWQGYAKVGVRNAMVISVASCCLVVDRINGKVAIALGAVGPTIVRCRETEAWLASQIDLRIQSTIKPSLLQELGERVANESKPIDDHRSTAAYRRHAVAVLSRRLLSRANTQ